MEYIRTHASSIRRFQFFKSGDFSVNDETHTGRPKTSINKAYSISTAISEGSIHTIRNLICTSERFALDLYLYCRMAFKFYLGTSETYKNLDSGNRGLLTCEGTWILIF